MKVEPLKTYMPARNSDFTASTEKKTVARPSGIGCANPYFRSTVHTYLLCTLL